MQQQKIKSPDQFRPNVLPRMSSTGPEVSSFRPRVHKEVNNPIKREKLLEILSQTDKGGIFVRADVLKLMDKKRVEDEAFRSKREKDMFMLDSSTEIFALPGKPEQTGLLSPEQRKTKGRSTRKQKAADSTIDALEKKDTDIEREMTDEFAFLNESLGISRVLKVREPDLGFLSDSDSPGHTTTPTSPAKSVPSSPQKQTAGTVGSNNTSDLDQIAGIMEGIVTGGDALNFFARFGADTPVKFVHLVLVEDFKLYR